MQHAVSIAAEPIKHLTNLAPIIAVLIFVILLLLALLLGMFCYMQADRKFWKSSYNDLQGNYRELQGFLKDTFHG